MTDYNYRLNTKRIREGIYQHTIFFNDTISGEEVEANIGDLPENFRKFIDRLGIRSAKFLNKKECQGELIISSDFFGGFVTV